MKNSFLRVRQWLAKNQRSVWLEYAVLSLAIIAPLLLPGYVLTLDLVFTPHAAWPVEITNTYPLQVILWVAQHILPGDIVEKIILFSILLFSGVGMHLLVYSLRVERSLQPFWNSAAYFAGILYMINPFTYSRFMAGQWMVLLGYALLPFFVRSFIGFFYQPTWRKAFGLSLWAVAILTVSLHHAGMLAVIGVCLAAAGMFHYWNEQAMLKRFMSGLLLCIGVVVVLSGYWLIPALLGCGAIGKSVASFDSAHFAAFATHGSGWFGPLGEVVRLQGFWAEAQNLYVLPQSLVPGWGIFFLFLWVLVFVGSRKAWRANRFVVGFCWAMIGVGSIVAATPLLQWMGSIVPIASGYREPHKFVNLIVLGYALLGAFGVAYGLRWAKKRRGETGVLLTTVVCLCLPLLLTPTMFWGFSGQLVPRSYPGEWVATNQQIKQKLSTGKRVLFLPWHQYAAYSFSGGRIIANPAQKFFEVPVIVSDEPEFRNVPPTVPNDEKRQISAALHDSKSLQKVLANLNIEYIILANEQDVGVYDYLNHTDGIRLVDANKKIKLYHVEEKYE